MKTASVRPPRGVPRGGVNENLTPVLANNFATALALKMEAQNQTPLNLVSSLT